MMKRVLCVWLPDWSVQRILQGVPEPRECPVVLFAPSPQRGCRVVACCKRATARGVVVDRSLAEARSLLEGAITSVVESHNPKADQAALSSLAARCRKFSPTIAIESTDAILLDITGCAHLFGDEHRMSQQIARTFAMWHFETRITVADCGATAWAVAQFGMGNENISIVPVSGSTAATERLPLAALKLDRNVIKTLHELDIRTIGQLRRISRESLPSRFGRGVLRRLDEIDGSLPETIKAMEFPEPIRAVWDFEYATGHTATIHTVIEYLLQQVVGRLINQQTGVVHVDCKFHSEQHSSVVVSLRLVKASQCAEHLLRLLLLQLEQVSLPHDLVKIVSQVVVSCPVRSEQQSLFGEISDSESQRTVAELFDRIAVRLGPDAIVRPHPVSDTQPEFRYHYASLLSTTSPLSEVRTDEQVDNDVPVHPLHVLPSPVEMVVLSTGPDSSPVRLQLDGRNHQVHRAWGPERVESGWWRQRHVSRDYYRVELDCGRQLWMFCECRTQNWFLHGRFE